MKVIHITSSLNDGGAEAVLFRLCTHDATNKHLVICLSDKGKYASILSSNGIEVYTLHMSPGWPSPIAFLELIRLLRAHKPNVVQTWLYHADLLGGLAARLIRVNSIVWGIHNTTLQFGNTKLLTIFIAKILSILSWWLPSKIVVCAQRSLETHYAFGYNREKMRYIPNGYNLEDFKPIANQDKSFFLELNNTDNTPLIGTVGRYDPLKDHSNLLKALSFLTKNGIKYQCLLVGTGLDENNEELVTLIKQLDLEDKVTLLGRRDDIPIIMNALDIHVLSSVSEAFPNVVAEAMACGTPCVVTDVGDSAYIVGETGWVVPPQNSNALAIALIEALKEINMPNWSSRCESARKRINDNFSIGRMVNSYNMLWKETVSKCAE